MQSQSDNSNDNVNNSQLLTSQEIISWSEIEKVFS